MKKQVTSIDPGTNQPTFGPDDTAYAIPDGREYYLNDMGVNYVVSCSGGVCDVKLENQSVANPANVASFVSDGVVFSQQSWGQTPSTFRFVTDAADARFMKLVYLDLALANALDLSTVPSWVATGLGARPAFILKYSEGNPVR